MSNNGIMTEIIKDTKTKAKETIDLLIDQAHTKLSSGMELSASDLKVCLDIAKQYGIQEKEKPDNIVENLPFDEMDNKSGDK